MSSRSWSASWNVIEPFIASRVRRATSAPLPQYLASSSMPSSVMTVESTSKHTTSALRMICAASTARFDTSTGRADTKRGCGKQLHDIYTEQICTELCGEVTLIGVCHCSLVAALQTGDVLTVGVGGHNGGGAAVCRKYWSR